MTRRTLAAVAAMLAFAVTGGAAATSWAAWVGTASGSATGGSTTFPAATPPDAVAGGGSVQLSWQPAELGTGTAASGYTVRRYAAASGGAAELVCTVAATTCTDASVPTSQTTWWYAVTAHYASWTSAESARTEVRVSQPDTAAPVVTVDAPPARTSGTPTLTGTYGTAAGDVAAVDLELTAPGQASRSAAATLSPAGTWSWSPSTPLASGTWTVVARQSDAAGNTGTASRTWTVDAAAPAVTIGTSPASPSTDETPTFAGGAGTATGDGPVSVRVTGAGYDETRPATISAGTWSVTWPTLAEGSYTVTASQSDDVGNAGTASRSYVVDRTAPTVTITFPVSGVAYPKSGQPNWNGNCGATNGACGTAADASPLPGGSYRLSYVDAQGTTRCWNGSTFAAGNCTAPQPMTIGSTGSWVVPIGKNQFPTGTFTYTLTVTAQDAAGNIGSAVRTFTVTS